MGNSKGFQALFDEYKTVKKIGWENKGWGDNGLILIFIFPLDIEGIIKLLGGNKKFVEQLDYIFTSGQFNMANEPDFSYSFLYNYSKVDEWRAQQKVHQLIKIYYKNTPYGLPGRMIQEL